jgi:hypothetical protein
MVVFQTSFIVALAWLGYNNFIKAAAPPSRLSVGFAPESE